MKQTKKINLLIAFAAILISLSLGSCSAVAGIFKAGMGFGVFIVLLVIVIIAVLVIRLLKNKNN